MLESEFEMGNSGSEVTTEKCIGRLLVLWGLVLVPFFRFILYQEYGPTRPEVLLVAISLVCLCAVTAFVTPNKILFGTVVTAVIVFSSESHTSMPVCSSDRKKRGSDVYEENDCHDCRTIFGPYTTHSCIYCSTKWGRHPLQNQVGKIYRQRANES